jgi:hypothetical protein
MHVVQGHSKCCNGLIQETTFNIDDLVAYKKPLSIPNDPFKMLPNSPLDDPIETSIPFTSTSSQKDNIDVILDEHIVFTMKDEV